MNLPEWAKHEEAYRPNRDRDYFISRSLLRVMAVLSAVRRQARMAMRKEISAAGALCFLLGWLLLCAASHTSAFLVCQFALETVVLCFLPGQSSRWILQSAVLATSFSLLLVLPAFLMGSGALVMLLPFKTFLTVTALGIFHGFLPWNQLTRGLRLFHVPQTVIFILDTTLRFVALLGVSAEDMLIALKMRSIGYNAQKQRALGGILGMLFLRAKDLSEAMYEAMVCRGFTGEYFPAKEKRFCLADFLFLLLFLGDGYLFLLLEVRL